MKGRKESKRDENRTAKRREQEGGEEDETKRWEVGAEHESCIVERVRERL